MHNTKRKHEPFIVTLGKRRLNMSVNRTHNLELSNVKHEEPTTLTYTDMDNKMPINDSLYRHEGN